MNAPATKPTAEDILALAQSLRLEIGSDFHERVVETIYADAARIASRAVKYARRQSPFNLERAIDRVVTSRVWGFPVMLLLFALVFWITISAANVPSGWISALLIDTIYPWLREGTASIGLP